MKQAPPGPEEQPLLGSLPAFRKDMLGFLMALAERHGNIAHFKLLHTHSYLLNHPDYIKEVLVLNHRSFHKSRGLQRAKRILGEGLLTSEGAFHLRQRRLVQPAFHQRRIAGYAQVMVDKALSTSARWERRGHGAQIDVAREMMRLTLSIVGSTLFDTDVEDETETVGVALDQVIQAFPLILLPFSEILEYLPLPSMLRYHRACARLDRTIYRIIDARRAHPVDHGDLLSMLLLAEREEGDGQGMTNRQVRDEVMTLFLAGHETTANALAWTWYLLSQHPDVEARVHEEVDRVLVGQRPTVEDLDRLPYCRMVLSESLRLYPPAWIIGRRALQSFQVGPYCLPPRSFVLMSPYVTHHDPRYYPDPYRFDPMRWTEAAQAERPKFSYFPFGGGPRVCIGERFAWTESLILLATIVQRWRLRLLPGHPVEVHPLITLRPKYGIRMILERRRKQPLEGPGPAGQFTIRKEGVAGER